MSGYDKNTNASKRRQLAQEALRMRIDGERHISEIEAIDAELATASADVPRLKARADIKFGLLRKVLPDLRSTDVTVDGDGEGGPIKHRIDVEFHDSTIPEQA